MATLQTLLGHPASATEQDITKAYHQAMLKAHSDKQELDISAEEKKNLILGRNN